jgi:hypothetical protein
MHFNIWALYAGPDQVMTVTSALAGLIGVLLMFWNRVVGTFFKVVDMFRKKDVTPAAPQHAVDPPNKLQ